MGLRVTIVMGIGRGALTPVLPMPQMMKKPSPCSLLQGMAFLLLSPNFLLFHTLEIAAFGGKHFPANHRAPSHIRHFVMKR
jgi:hypothetical protein